MIDKTEQEINAIKTGSDAAGEYIQHLGKTDLAAFSSAEWELMFEVAITAFYEAMSGKA